MKKNNTFMIFALLTASLSSYAGLSDEALKLIPGGKVVAEKKEEVKIQTPEGSIVEVEYERGKFEEASGDNAEKDVLVPGEGLLSLKDAVASLKKSGKTPVGDWSLDKSFIKGWHYEFEGFENNQKMDYIVDAKTGKLLESKIDD